jgi:hypothetical protein
MKYMTRWIPFFSLVFLVISPKAFAIHVNTGTEDFTLNVDFNLQLRLEGTYGGPPPTATSGAAPSGHFNTDIFLRRASLSVIGTGFKVFTYYIKLESGKFGARGDYSVASLLQDVVLGYVPFADFTIEGGFLKTPLSRPAVDSSWRNNSLEGVSDILFYPNARAQRQNGLQLRTLFLDHRILFRGGIYEGARTGFANGRATSPPFPTPYINPNGLPMFGGMARVNLVGYENGYTYPGMYLDGSTRVSLGVGGQYQNRSGAVQADGTVADYSVVASDFYADIALSGDNEALFSADAYRWNYGAGAAKTGVGAHGEVGYRWGPIEPQASFYWFNSDTRTNSFLRWAAGLTYFIKGHRVKIMLEYESTISNGVLPNTPGLQEAPWLRQILLQGQLHF